MKIGVIADTHSNQVSPKIFSAFKGVEFIVHAGDFCSLKDLKSFEKVARVEGVVGNMDDEGIRKKFSEKIIFSFKGFQIGVYHGRGTSANVLKSVQDEFKGDKVDAVIFGHSHLPFNETIKGVLYFNPGSATDVVFSPYLSYGFLEVKNGKLVGKIVKVN